MDLLKTFGPLLGSVAPSIATALGGPLAGMATKALSLALLGNEEGSEDDLQTALRTASPEQLATVKKIDADFKVQMKSQSTIPPKPPVSQDSFRVQLVIIP